MLVSDGRNFFEGEPAAGYLRLSFSMLDEQLLVEGALAAHNSFARGLAAPDRVAG